MHKCILAVKITTSTRNFKNLTFIKGLSIWEARRDVCRDGTLNGISPCNNICHIHHVVLIWKCLPGRFSLRPGKAGSRFAQLGSRLKRDNFYHVNTPSRFAGTILCKLSRVKSSQVETFSCKPGMKNVSSRQTSHPTSHINIL